PGATHARAARSPHGRSPRPHGQPRRSQVSLRVRHRECGKPDRLVRLCILRVGRLRLDVLLPPRPAGGNEEPGGQPPRAGARSGGGQHRRTPGGGWVHSREGEEPHVDAADRLSRGTSSHEQRPAASGSDGTPTVTVVIPVYNGGRTIGPALQSVFDQTYTDYEVIVVDDGSTDDTAAEVGRWAGRVRYERQANGGPARARNK